jgi:hypothetical protein
VLAGLLVVSGVALRFGPLAWAWWRRHRAAAAESESAYFTAFERVCRTGDARATQRALLAWLDRFLADDPAPSTEGLAARAADPELAAELTALEGAAYGHTTGGRQWSPTELSRRVRAARSRLRRNATTEPAGVGALPPLNPTGNN